MAGENVTARIDGQLTDFKQLAAQIRDELREVKELVAEQGETLAGHGSKLDVLAVRMDGLKTEMRLMWGALGALVTVLGLSSPSCSLAERSTRWKSAFRDQPPGTARYNTHWRDTPGSVQGN